MIKPRKYQDESSDITVQSLLNNSNGIIVMPVGSGKTLAMALAARKIGEPILVIAPNQSLVLQNYEAAVDLGVDDCAIYCAGLGYKDIGTVTFCTVKSAKADIESFKMFNYAIIDECDLQFKPGADSEYNKFFKAAGIKSYVGYTGTPYTTVPSLNGSKIKIISKQRPSNFKNILYHLPVKYMMDNGYWSKIEYISYEFDEALLELNSNKTDFTPTSVQKAIETLSVNNNAYILIRKMLNKGYKGILVYCNSLNDAEIFKRNVPNSEIISYETKSSDRQRIISEFKSGVIDVLFNLNTMKSGFNMPSLKWIVTIPAFGSIRDWIQIGGRGVRTHPDKEKCTIIDFGGNIKRYGRVEDIDILQDYKGSYELYSNSNVLLSSIYRHEIGKYILDKDTLKINKELSESDSKKYYKMKTGKYKGKPLVAIPRYYLQWMVDNMGANLPIEVRIYMEG